MRTYGPPLADGERRAAPLEISAVAQRGVIEMLRAARAAIEATRAKENAPTAPAPAWTT